MIRHAGERALQGLLVLLAASFAIYMLLGLMPGDPVELMASGNPDITPDDIRRLRELHGLDRPLTARYADWLAALLQGDLGYSRIFSKPVLATVGPYLANTAALMLASFVLALAIGLPLGLVAAARRGGWLDAAINGFAFVSAAVPTFWLGLLMIVLFAVVLGWLPASALPPPCGRWSCRSPRSPSSRRANMRATCARRRARRSHRTGSAPRAPRGRASAACSSATCCATRWSRSPRSRRWASAGSSRVPS
jgi:peptide/nickel transport system permease protein